MDDDNDGVEDLEDVFPFDSSESSDFDGDNIGDNADSDDDNDGYSDVDENASGSNPQDSSVVPDDWDDDWLSDMLDDDDDNDEIVDDDDDCNREIGKNWGVRETDTTYSHNSALDYDMDGCRDADEDDDDDNDKRDDGDDSCPLGELNWDSRDSTDFDGDGCRDDKPEDDNDDNDAWKDQEEITCGTNPLDASSYPPDFDGDGICDLIDQLNGTELKQKLQNSKTTMIAPHPNLFLIFFVRLWNLMNNIYLYCVWRRLLSSLLPLVFTHFSVIDDRTKGWIL